MTKKIKLIFDATILVNALGKNSNRSGIFFTAYEILKELKRRSDVEITFYCSPRKQSLLRKLKEFSDLVVYPPVSIFDTWRYQLQHNKSMAKQKHRVIEKIFWHYLKFFSRPFLYFACLVEKVFNKQNKLHTEIFFAPMEAFPKKALRVPCKYVLLYDAIPLLYPQYYPEVKTGKYWLLDVINQLKSNSACYAFAISEQTKKDFLKLIPELKPNKITVTPLACSKAFHPCLRKDTIKSLKKYGLPTDKRYVFSLCSLEPRKNLIRAVKTFIQFIKKNKIDDMVFILGGGHWEEFIGKLDLEIAGLGVYKDKIIKAGYIDDEDLAPLYSGAEWFVYTSQYEGFGLPPLEAMACGCPVITSNNSSLPEVVGEAGIMIDWDSDEQHIKAYEKYYHSPKLREEMRQKGLKRAKQFSWDKTVDLMLKQIRKDIK